MPNQQGGKNYKKAKHSSSTMDLKVQEAETDQLYGRVLKTLGNLNMSVFCNDNRIRICKVCGAMKKRVWVNIGDLVIVSLRDFEQKKADDEGKKTDSDCLRGDIIYRFDPTLLSKAKKLPNINQKLFMQLENTDGKVLNEIGSKGIEIPEDDDGGIEFDRSSGDEDEETKEGEVISKSKKELKKSKESKVAAMDRDNNNDDDFNVDDI